MAVYHGGLPPQQLARRFARGELLAQLRAQARQSALPVADARRPGARRCRRGPGHASGIQRGPRRGAGRNGEHLAAGRGHQHGVLPLRRQAVVLGHHGPAVGELPDLGLAGVDHRLDGEGHARLQREADAAPAVVEDLRLFVELPADAVPAELAHHAVAVLLGVRLDGVADVAQVRARPHLADALPQAFVGHLAQAARLDRGIADVKHAAGVAMEAVLDHRYVDVDDVPGTQLLVAGHAVTHHVVDRGADRLGERLVAGRRVVERGRGSLLLAGDEFMAEAVELARRGAGLDVRSDIVENLGGALARNAHFLDVLRGLDADGH